MEHTRAYNFVCQLNNNPDSIENNTEYSYRPVSGYSPIVVDTAKVFSELTESERELLSVTGDGILVLSIADSIYYRVLGVWVLGLKHNLWTNQPQYNPSFVGFNVGGVEYALETSQLRIYKQIDV